jgi:glucose-6-phosphate isomerase, archaeal
VLPQAILIDPNTGVIEPSTGRYQKRLSDLQEIFHNEEARARDIRSRGDPLVYEVMEYRKEGSDLFFGTTTVFLGRSATNST